ncbi:hypothetical protein D3C78_1708850 [compost metagenome]
MGMRPDPQRQGNVIDRFVQLDIAKPLFGKTLGHLQADAFNGLAVFGGELPVEVDLSHPQFIALFSQ